MEPYQVQLFRARVDRESMEKKGYSTFPKGLGMEHHR